MLFSPKIYGAAIGRAESPNRKEIQGVTAISEALGSRPIGERRRRWGSAQPKNTLGFRTMTLPLVLHLIFICDLFKVPTPGAAVKVFLSQYAFFQKL